MPLASVRAAFSHPDWIFELKWDGFRSLAYIGNSRCRLVSRNGNDFKSFPTLSESIASALGSRSAVIDGEIVCLDRRGKPQFRDLLHHRGEPRFVAFDLLRIDGEDLTYVPLTERKAKLRALVSNQSEHLLYCDHVEADGEKLFRLACTRPGGHRHEAEVRSLYRRRSTVGEEKEHSVLAVGGPGEAIRARA